MAVLFVGACCPYSTVCLTRYHTFSYVRIQADVPVRWFVFVARSTAHGPDNKIAVQRACLPPDSYGTTTLLPSSSSRGHTLRVWAIVCTMVADLSKTAIDHSTTLPPHHHHLSPCCFFCVLLCVIQLRHCFSCAQHSAPTAAAGSVLCACGRSALFSQYYSRVRCCSHRHRPMHAPAAVCDRHF